ncbi:hypothetical protein RND81_05G273600 [Saponaria officinalis]|uniref:Protein kinase domain-containing protein n=1 Tax=Saponaria officinalis TaxID=3572 RepID=A0AAW1L2V2_SAPOF
MPTASYAASPCFTPAASSPTSSYPTSATTTTPCPSGMLLFSITPYCLFLIMWDSSYADAGFDIKDVFLHIRLMEQACGEEQPALAIQEDHLTFACNTCVTWTALSSALDASSLCCTQHHIFHTKSCTLGILGIPLNPPLDFKTRLHNALTSAAASSSSSSKKPKFTTPKLPFRLCGCQQHHPTPSDNDPRNSVDHSNPPIHLTLPLSSSALLVSVDEWQTVRPASTESDTCLLTSDALDFTHHLRPTSFKGFYKANKVAIDKLKGCDKGNAYDFLIRKDLLQLMTSGHTNLLPFYGVCVHEVHGLCVVTRFMEGGTLHDFVLKHKKIPIKDVIKIAIDIAQGLKFMNDHGVAYQDLNTLRVFLDRHGNACLGDMGIVTACNTAAEPMEYETDGYRWLAPEIIAADPESVKETWMSNVYSYGMLVWEMVTGEAAYSACSPVQAAVGIAACGLRPDIPTDCPQLLASLMLKCWNNCPSKRPPFSEILGVLL